MDQSPDKFLVDSGIVDDLALDFIEQEVGRLRFQQNWPAMQDKLRRITIWVAYQGFPAAYVPSVAKLVQAHWEAGLRYAVPTYDKTHDKEL